MNTESKQPVYPLSIPESIELQAARNKTTPREGWTQIESVRRDATGKLRVSFSNWKKGYYEKMRSEGKIGE